MADDEPRELEGEPKAEPKQLSLKEVQAAKDAVYMFKPDPTAGCHTRVLAPRPTPDRARVEP